MRRSVTAADQGVWALACEACGAEPGQPCDDDCPGFSQWDSDRYAGSDSRLMAAVYRLPFGALVGDPPERGDSDAWLSDLADWMTQYEQILRVEVERLQAGVRKAIGLQLEKDVVQAWLKGSDR